MCGVFTGGGQGQSLQTNVPSHLFCLLHGMSIFNYLFQTPFHFRTCELTLKYY